MKRSFLSIFLFIGLHLTSYVWGEPLTVATSFDPPLVYYKEKQKTQHTGSTVELIQDIAHRLNRKVEFKLVPWKRALLEAEKGKVDAICCAGVTEERLKFLYFPDLHITSEENVLFVRKGNPIQVNKDYTNVASINLGVMNGYVYGPLQKAIDEERFGRVSASIRYESAIRMLLYSRTDIFVGDRLVVAYNAKLIGARDQIEIMKKNKREFVVSSWLVHLAFSKKRLKDPSYMDRVTQSIVEMKKDGTYERIIRKYVD